MRVLLVDDSNTMRRIVINQIKDTGVTDIIEATNGEEGLTLLAANMPVDLIVLDINMPVLDGMAMLRKVRSEPKYKDVKIVMVTSESEKTKVMDAIAAGANDYLVKPFTTENLIKKLGLGQ
ncbi:MAG: response regulator [Fibrobacter sp.]|nr:response regulator [Fibrobacter sp.]